MQTLNSRPMLQAIVQGIEATEIVPGRCEVIDEEQEFGVVVDSANDPKSLSLLLDSIQKIEPRRLILITGCEGERNRDARPFIGEIAHYKVCRDFPGFCPAIDGIRKVKDSYPHNE